MSEVIRLVVMIYVRFPLSLRNVEDLLFKRGIDVCRDGAVVMEHVLAVVRGRHPPPAGESDARLPTLALAPRQDVVKFNGEMVHLRRTIDHKGVVKS